MSVRSPRLSVCLLAAVLFLGACAFLVWHGRDDSRSHAATANGDRGAAVDASALASRVGEAGRVSIARFVATLQEAEIAAMFREPAAFFPDGMSRAWRRALLARWTELKPDAAAAYARAAGPNLLAIVLEAWTARDALAAVAWLKQFGDAALADALLRADEFTSLPTSAALVLFERLGEDASPELGIELLSGASPADLIAWLSDSSTTSQRHRALVQFAQTDPERARETLLEAMRQVPALPERQQLLNVIIGEWGRSDPIAATAWLEQLPDAKSYAGVWASLTAQWAEKHPPQAAQIAVQLPAGPAQHQAVISAVSGWARLDPPATAAWVSRFPEGELRNEAMQQLVFAWAMRDAAAVENWMALLPHGPSRDAAMKTFETLEARGRITRSNPGN